MRQHVVALGAGVLLLVACTGPGGAAPPDSKRSTPAAAPSTAYASGPQSVPVSVATAAVPATGVVLPIVTMRIVEAGRNRGVLGVTEDGAMLVSSSRYDGRRRQSVRLQPAHLVLVDPTGRARRLDRGLRRDQPRQITGATTDGRYVAWMETPSTTLDVDPWVLYVHDLGSGRVRQLARAPRVGGQPPPPVPGFTGPTIAGGRVFWAQVGGERARGLRVGIYSSRLDGRGAPRLEVPAAALPVATGDRLYYVRMRAYGAAGTDDRAQVRELDLRTGEDRLVHVERIEDGAGVSGLAASGRRVAWVTMHPEGPDTVTLLGPGGEKVALFESESEGGFGYPMLTERYLAWAESSGVSEAGVGAYLYDLATGSLLSLGNTAGLYGLAGAGDLVVWQESRTPAVRPEDIEYVVGRLGAPSASSGAEAPSTTAPADLVATPDPEQTTPVPAERSRPAAGVCEPVTGPVVTVRLAPDAPAPRCLVVGPEQRLRVVNDSLAYGQPGVVARVRIAGFTEVPLKPGHGVLFDAAFGGYLAPGVHTLHADLYAGSGATSVWLRE